MRMRNVARGAWVVGMLISASAGWAGWEPIGPPGGDVREITADPRDPRVVYLGTSDGALYRSSDAGATWSRCTPGLGRRGVSLDDVIVGANGEILVGFWATGGSGGGVARSTDGGVTFTALAGIEGHSVRGLAVAASDPRIYVAVALDGVFRSDDAGETWRRISAPETAEQSDRSGLRNFGSLAVDPVNPEIVYAGTWRLSWKTMDGGQHWRLASGGMIVDSDVMTLTVDRRAAARVYATACSGIYRSLDGAGRWARIAGIPSSSRRTRAFLQDPRRPEVFYAGTTEGLWRSEDDLRTWRRLTPADVVVNAIEVLSDGTILLGCDGLGVVRSADGGVSFAPATAGLLERPVTCAFFDEARRRVVVGVSADRAHGGVWTTAWPGGAWSALGTGLAAREVLVLSRAAHGLLAGTDDGLFLLDEDAAAWRRLATVIDGVDVHPRVSDVVATSAGTLLAATSAGLLRGTEGGRVWTRYALGDSQSVRAVAWARGSAVAHAATPLGFFASSDDGASWVPSGPAPADGLVRRLIVSPLDEQMLFAATTRGLLKSHDGGRTWRIRGGGLPVADITTLALRGGAATLLAADHTYGGLYRSSDLAETWTRIDGEGLPSQLVWSLTAVPASEELLAGAATGGLYRWAPPTSGAAGVAIAAQ